MTKVLLQVASKAGNVPWAPSVPGSVRNTMLVGLDLCKQAGRRLTSLVATTNPAFSKFYSVVQSQDVQSCFIEKIDDLMCRALESYYIQQKSMPAEIIVFRTGLPANQMQLSLEREVNKLQVMFKKISAEYSPKLTFLIVDKGPS